MCLVWYVYTPGYVLWSSAGSTQAFSGAYPQERPFQLQPHVLLTWRTARCRLRVAVLVPTPARKGEHQRTSHLLLLWGVYVLSQFTLPFFDYQGNRTSPVLLDNQSETLSAVRRKSNTQASVCAAASLWRKGSSCGPCLKILWLRWSYPQSQSCSLSLFPSFTLSSGLP